MSLATNLTAAENAVREVKKSVQYSSNNLVSDRAAHFLADQEYQRKHFWEPQSRAEAKAARKQTEALVTAPVSTKKAFFENLALPQAAPPKDGVRWGQFGSSLHDRMNASRGVKDQFGNEIVPSGVDQRVANFVAVGFPDNNETLIYAMAEEAKFQQVGNCAEQAAIAMTYLHGSGVRPLDYMYFGNTPTYDHAWVVIGRVDGSDIWDVRTWGPDAVWCDPWQLRDGRVYSMEAFCRGGVTNLDQTFKLGSVELVNAGQPAVMWRVY